MPKPCLALVLMSPRCRAALQLLQAQTPAYEWAGAKLGPRFRVGVCVPAPLRAEGWELWALHPSTRTASLWEVGLSTSLDCRSHWHSQEGFECLGSWCLRPPGVMSCLPSEGAGSGARPHLLSVPELCRYLAESWLTFQIHLQELLQYKRQNPAQVTSPESYNSSCTVGSRGRGWGQWCELPCWRQRRKRPTAVLRPH